MHLGRSDCIAIKIAHDDRWEFILHCFRQLWWWYYQEREKPRWLNICIEESFNLYT